MTHSHLRYAHVLVACLIALPISLHAQEAATSSQPLVPHLVRYSGTVSAAPEDSGVVEVRFSIYAAQSGGDVLWTERQYVPIDATGKYSALLGTAKALPDSIFASGEARWVGVTLTGQPEGTRTALAASAYALKASDAETLGGHPATDFLLAAKDGAKPATATNISQINVGSGITGGGTGPTVSLGVDLNYLVAQGDSTWAQLGAANTFSKPQTINGNLTVNGNLGGTALNNLVTQGNSIWSQLGASNTFTGGQIFKGTVYENNTVVDSGQVNGTYLNYITNTGTGGALSVTGATAILASGTSSDKTSSAIFAASTSGYGLYASGGNSGILSVTGGASNTYNSSSSTRAGVFADGGAGGFAGLFATADAGTAISGINNSANSALVTQNQGSGPAAYFLNNSSGQYSLIAGNNAAGPAAYLSGASPSTAILTVKNLVTTNPQNTQIAQFLGDNAGNVGCTVFGNGIFSCSNELIGNGDQAVQGYSTSGEGIYGSSSATFGEGVYGIATAANGYGVIGLTSAGTAGVAGRYGDASGTHGAISGYQGGVIADGGSENHTGLIAEADAQSAVYAQNNAPNNAAIFALNAGGGNGLYINQNSGGSEANIHSYSTSDVWAYFDGFDGTCEVVASGEFDCTGDINSNQSFITGDAAHGGPVSHTVQTTAVQGARSWVEEAGSADLIDGRAIVQLPADFSRIANSDIEYQVFLTPGGDCTGLYAAHKKGGSFEVHELQGGHSSLRFDYRILAERRGKEGHHLVDVTEKLAEQRKREASPVRASVVEKSQAAE